jgi:hypothetical protein
MWTLIHSFVVGQYQTLTRDRIGFAAELTVNLAVYLAAAGDLRQI